MSRELDYIISFSQVVDEAWKTKQAIVEILGKEIMFDTRPGPWSRVSFIITENDINLLKLCLPEIEFEYMTEKHL